MGTDPRKEAAMWFSSTIFQDEPVGICISSPRFSTSVPQEQEEAPLPSLLRAARSLEPQKGKPWQNERTLFLKQAKLLVDYQDDYPIPENFLTYFPTYQKLPNAVLRGYFSWRTKLRKGCPEKGPLSFVYLHIYELINQIGVSSPLEGFQALLRLHQYFPLPDGDFIPHLEQWLVDYVAYYNLDAGLVAELPMVAFTRNLSLLNRASELEQEPLIAAIKALSPQWLNRSRFYRQHTADCDRVIHRVLIRMQQHFSKRTQKTLATHFFGNPQYLPLPVFQGAIFTNPRKIRNLHYAVNDGHVYTCKDGVWSITKSFCPDRGIDKLNALLKAIDAQMRLAFGDKHPIRHNLTVKWQLAVIEEEIQRLLAEKQAAQAKKLTFNRKALSKIRKEAAITQKKLTVEEEWEEEAPPPIPQAPPVCPVPGDTPLSPQEYRLVQCLLYERSLSWIQAEGCILSVLVDGINEKLYDTFQDTVLEDSPALIEDYIDELKEMVAP